MNLTQKISQMTPKGADLDATDLIEVSTIVGGSYVTKSITGQELIDAIPLPPTGLTVGTTPISSGTIGRVLFQGTGNVLQQSGNLFWDDTNNRLGIGTSSPSQDVSVVRSNNGNTALTLTNANTGSSAVASLNAVSNTTTSALFSTSSTFANYGVYGASQSVLYSTKILSLASDNSTLSEIRFGTGTPPTERMRIFSTGNVLINTTTDAGFRLDVNGTARVQGNTTVALNQNAPTRISITNTTSGNAAGSELLLTSNSSALFALGKVSSSYTLYKIIAAGDGYALNTTNGDIAILNDFATGRIKFATGGASTAQMTLFSTGNFAINTTTDAGFRLDVNGTARVVGILRAETYVQYGTNANVGIGSTANGGSFGNGPAFLYSSANINTSAIYAHNFNTGAFNSTSGNQGVLNVPNATFNPTSGTAVFNAFNLPFTINQTGGANGITRGLFVNPTLTAAADFRAIETARGNVVFGNLPTSSAGLPTGAIWNDGGTLKIV